MIAYLDGKLAYKDPTYLIIDVNGVGYQVNISLNTFATVKDQERCKVHTYLHVTENSQSLYGFSQASEKGLFLSLISVSGIGPSTALVMLSQLEPEELKQAILTDDVRLIQSVKGVGAKTAQRVILELKDKLGKAESFTEKGEKIASTTHNTLREEALSALTTLGIPKSAAEKNINKVLSTHGKDIPLEDIIKYALKNT